MAPIKSWIRGAVCAFVGFAVLGFALPGLAVERSVRLEAFADEESGSSPEGRRVSVTVYLSGQRGQEREKGIEADVVALFASPGMPRALVPMTPGPRPGELEATTKLEVPPAVWSAVPPTLRIEVGFARVRGMRLDYLLRRTLSVRLDQGLSAKPRPSLPSPSASLSAGTPDGLGGPLGGAEPAGPIDSRAGLARAVEDHALTEIDLLAAAPASEKAGPGAYWQEMNRRLSHHWGRRQVKVAHDKVRRNPRVGFRLYANGSAEAIRLERSSGSQQVDDAGLQSVVATQPFAPFPPALAEPYVDVHVDFRAKRASR